MKYQEILFRPNTLCHGDCLHILQRWVKEGHKVDLIYLDPPFNSKRDYNINFGKDFDERVQFVAFQDTWNWSLKARQRMDNLMGSSYGSGGRMGKIMEGLELQLGESDMLAYVSYMAERLIWMREILKDSGSLYLHCDPTASHYLKVVLDGVFGAENFRNEITWKRYRGKRSGATKKFAAVTDILFFYGKTSESFFNPVFNPLNKKYVDKTYRFDDKDGKGPYRFGGRIRDRKYYLKNSKGVALTNFWDDVPELNGTVKEALGYPTQKPRALLERIINASSNKGDLVLDPFCGCGTAADAAYQTGRGFIGIDILPYAITEVCRTRLKDVKGVTIQGLPVDFKSAAHLAANDPFAFEQWAVSKIPGFMPNEKQVGDGGVDGKARLQHVPFDATGEKLTRSCVAQVKVTKPSPDAIRALLSRITGGQSAIGIFITLKKQKLTPTMEKAIANAGTLNFGGVARYPRLLFWSIQEFFADTFPKMPDRAHPITGQPLSQTEISEAMGIYEPGLLQQTTIET